MPAFAEGSSPGRLTQECAFGFGTAGYSLEATPSPTRAAVKHLAAVKRWLKRCLQGRSRTVLLMLDETIVTETPPLYAAYGHIGGQVQVPITGNRAKRI